MMNKEEKMLNKFDFDKYWEIRQGLVAGRTAYSLKYKDTGWSWLNKEIEKIDAAIDTLDELNDFLVVRGMVKYDDDVCENVTTPRFKEVA
jgi:hypothetical protein